MPKKIKKGTKGEVNYFLTRAKAIRKLGLPLKDFRRLCILKGIFPRMPSSNKLRQSTQTYYHLKDVNYLMHDKLVSTFKLIRIHNKKIEKALARNDKTKLEILRRTKPKYSLDHIIKERYPSFEDALGDLDDCLSTLALLASLPSHRLFKIPASKINKAKKYLSEFKEVIKHLGLVTKVFLSIKGVYYQCNINGVDVTWLEPYQFTQSLTFDVDFKVIMSFCEFYYVLLRFVNYKLYFDNNIEYPPKQLEGAYVLNIKSNNDDDDKFKISEEFAKYSDIKNIFKNKKELLFKGLTFFISREVNKDIFEFLIRSQGGNVAYDIGNFESETFKANNITHVVTDRPLNSISIIKNREYIQPQWIADSINNNILLPITDYYPGKPLPPHLSPFIDSAETGYKPEREKEINKIKNEDYHEESVDYSDDTEDNNNENKPEIVDKHSEVTYKVEKNIKEKKPTKKDLKKAEKEQEELAIKTLPKRKKRLVERIKYTEKKKKEENKKLKEKVKTVKKRIKKGN